MTNPSPTLDRAKIEAIKAGTEGVTLGPWLNVHSIDKNEMLRCEVRQVDFAPTDKHHWPFRVAQTVAGQFANADRVNFDHLARLDPATVNALCDLALEALSRAAPSGSDMVLVPRADLDSITLNVNHALMVLPTPKGSGEKRAWSSLIDAKNALGVLAATQPQGADNGK